jgi:hypothetical protein
VAMNPELTTEDRDDLFEKIKAIEIALANAEADLAKKTSERKLAKEVVEDLVFQLRRQTRELASPTALPLFDRDGQEAEDRTPDVHAVVEETLPDGQPVVEPAADRDAWKAAPITDVALEPEVLEALKADGVTTVGEFCRQTTEYPTILEAKEAGKLSRWYALKSDSRWDAGGVVGDWIQPRLPRCRICDEQPSDETDDEFFTASDPTVCVDCEPFKDGVPDVEAIAADAPSDYSKPEALRKKPLASAAAQLKRLQDAHEDQAGRLEVQASRYRELAAQWPGPEPATAEERAAMQYYQASPRTKFVSALINARAAVSKTRGGLQLLDAAIAEAQARVAAKPAAKKSKAKPAQAEAAP